MSTSIYVNPRYGFDGYTGVASDSEVSGADSSIDSASECHAAFPSRRGDELNHCADAQSGESEGHASETNVALFCDEAGVNGHGCSPDEHEAAENHDDQAMYNDDVLDYTSDHYYLQEPDDGRNAANRSMQARDDRAEQHSNVRRNDWMLKGTHELSADHRARLSMDKREGDLDEVQVRAEYTKRRKTQERDDKVEEFYAFILEWYSVSQDDEKYCNQVKAFMIDSMRKKGVYDAANQDKVQKLTGEDLMDWCKRRYQDQSGRAWKAPAGKTERGLRAEARELRLATVKAEKKEKKLRKFRALLALKRRRQGKGSGRTGERMTPAAKLRRIRMKENPEAWVPRAPVGTVWIPLGESEEEYSDSD
jgi:hypothetical protein